MTDIKTNTPEQKAIGAVQSISARTAKDGNVSLFGEGYTRLGPNETDTWINYATSMRCAYDCARVYDGVEGASVIKWMQVDPPEGWR